MLNNDNIIKGSCSYSELQKILAGSGNLSAGNIDLPSCENDGGGFGLKGYPLAMVYSPMQEFDNIYDIDKGFKTGTIFSELDLPFNGRSLANKGGIGGCYDK